MKRSRLGKFQFVAAFTLLLVCAVALFRFPAASESNTEFPFKPNDRVAWIGSSSTRIGTWCRTMEFLLRTRHPELKLTFSRGTTGGGTFLTGAKNLPTWLNDFKPTYVLFNYGGNDSGAGIKGIAQFKLNMQKCLELAEEKGARVQFTTHQSGDVRVTSAPSFDARKTYAETMISFAQEKNWTIYDTHHPLEAFQLAEVKDVPDFTINKDKIHLTDCAYVAWGYFLYERMNPPIVESLVELTADGKVVTQNNCVVSEVTHAPGKLTFTRADAVLPVLPPDPIPAGNVLKTSTTAPDSASASTPKDIPKDPAKSGNAVPGATPSNLPPRAKPPAAPAFKIPAAQVTFAKEHGQELPPRNLVPLEKLSRYMLKVTGLEPGDYVLSCDGKAIGIATDKELAAGANINTLLLNSKNPAPWNDLVKDLWLGKRSDEIGKTRFVFTLEKAK